MVTGPSVDRTAGKPRTRTRAALAGALGAALLGLVFVLLPPLLELDEEAGLAALFAVRGPRMPPPDVAVVSISKESAAGVGQSSELDEWPRSLHADLIKALRAAGARLIVFDVIFDKPRDTANDAELAGAIGASADVVLVEGVGGSANLNEAAGSVRVIEEVRRPPLPAFRRASLATSLFTLPTVP